MEPNKTSPDTPNEGPINDGNLQSSPEPVVVKPGSDSVPASQPPASPEPSAVNAAESPEPLIAQPVVSTFGQPPASKPGRFKRPSKKVLAIGLAVLVLIILSAGYVFGMYLPNKPANVYQTGMERSGENLNKLVEKITDEEHFEKIQNSQIVATAQVKSFGSTFNGAFAVKLDKTRADGSLDVKVKEPQATERILNIKFLSSLRENKKYPDLYFQVNGTKALGLSDFVPGIDAYEGKWIAVESDYLESIGYNQEGPKNREQVTSEEIASLARTISSTTNEYLLTSDKNKAVLENKKYIGRETTDGISTHRYEVGVNKAHAKEFCRVLTERVISHPASKKLANLDDKGVEEQKKNIAKDCDADVDEEIKDGMTMDLWIDAKYKLIHKLRIYDANNKSNYADIGQKYTGGDKISFFLAYHSESDKIDAKLTTDVDTKSYTSKGKFTWVEKKEEGMEGAVTFEAKPYDGEVKADKPAGAINIQEVLSKFGISPPQASAPGGNIQMKAKDAERQTDIKALHAQLEAFYANNGYYPSLTNLNNTSWRATNMRGLDKEALKDPDGTASVLAAAATSKQYGYKPAECNAAGTECQAYSLSALLSTGAPYTKTSLQ